MTSPTASAWRPAASLALQPLRWLLSLASVERKLPVVSQPHWEACWPEGQDRLIVADVAAQSDEVLLAVHQPPRLLEMPVPLPGRRAEAAAQSHEATQEMLL